MENTQSWMNGLNQQIRPISQQPVNVQFGLTREEQLEAKRLAEEANFSFEGYQVVRREFISHRFDPAMTIKGNSITFNNACISKLENASYIQFLINPTEQKMIIRPCDEGARDAIRWCVLKADKRKSRQITCKIFAERLYEMMGWDPIYRYRLQGMKIRYNNEQMYLFDLNSHECFLPQKKDPAKGKVKAASAQFPQDWQSGFGMNVSEHDMSTQVNFLEGYISPNDTEQTEGSDE